MAFMHDIANQTNIFARQFQRKSMLFYCPTINGVMLFFTTLDMDYFLHEFDDEFDDEIGAEGFYIF